MWCSWCSSDDHKSRQCGQHCPRCDEQHRLEDCDKNHYEITCTFCQRRGHVESVCHMKLHGDFRGTSQIGNQQSTNQSNNKQTPAHAPPHSSGGGNRNPPHSTRVGNRICRFWKNHNCFKKTGCSFAHEGPGGTCEAPTWFTETSQSGHTSNNHNNSVFLLSEHVRIDRQIARSEATHPIHLVTMN